MREWVVVPEHSLVNQRNVRGADAAGNVAHCTQLSRSQRTHAVLLVARFHSRKCHRQLKHTSRDPRTTLAEINDLTIFLYALGLRCLSKSFTVYGIRCE